MYVWVRKYACVRLHARLERQTYNMYITDYDMMTEQEHADLMDPGLQQYVVGCRTAYLPT